jgi:hypothetical protein
MLKNWLIEYWWILASLLYVILVMILMRVLVRRGTFDRTWPKIILANTCVIVIFIPTMHPPWNYTNAAVVVFNLLVLFRITFKSEKSPEPRDR